MCKCKCNNSEPSRFVYYIDVGQLPRESAEKYVKEQMEKFKEQLAPHEKSSWLFVPTRSGNTRVERL